MGDKTSISWANATWNPVVGCSRVSPGCDDCYAIRTARRQAALGQAQYEGLTRERGGRLDWTGEARFVPHMLDQPLRWKKPRGIFVVSMGDLFHVSITNEQIAAVFGVMAASPQHRFYVLTKRAKRMRDVFSSLTDEAIHEAIARAFNDDFACAVTNYITGWSRWRDMPDDGNPFDGSRPRWPLPNVALGVSAEDQQRLDERVPDLLACPAALRFLSLEPLLGPIDVREALIGNVRWDSTGRETDRTAIDYVIPGGESGPGARPCDVAWIRSIVHQCREAGTSVHVKQVGARAFDSAEVAGEFTSYEKWVNKARSWLGGVSGSGLRYKPRERVVCTDARGRLCSVGGDFMRARDEEAFPVRWHPLFAHRHTKGGEPAEWAADLRAARDPWPWMRGS